MKKILIAALMAVAVVPLAAQETYENAKIAAEDLNGTARYVGMGGAMDALGADISTIATNPAGIGLFRRSNASVSFGAVIQGDAPSMAGADKFNMSFDQAGFVISANTSGKNQSFVNFGFNYHKSRNFDYILSAADRLTNASQNKLSYVKAKNELLYPLDNSGRPDLDRPYITCNQLDDIYTTELLYDQGQNLWLYDNASDYRLDRAHSGYIGEYDFNVSGNINNRVYLGLTVGYHDVHYKHYGEYTENLKNIGTLRTYEDRRITGGGVDVKFGIIFRPIEYSPFRVGLSVATPTFYKLTTENELDMTDGSYTAGAGESYKFKLYTPWKFGLSLGHTIGKDIALGASYEYADYGSLDTRYITDGYYDYWSNTYSDQSVSDNTMNRHTDTTLRGVSTLKLGAEFKPTDELALRVGYNYVSPMYHEDGYKDGTLDTEGSYYSSATDYTNWKSTNRFTCGIGYTFGQLNLSAAYQLSSTSGEFSPFMNYVDNNEPDDNILTDVVKVKNVRHQLLLTLGYTF